jgi:hypothetical protein
MLTAGEKTEAAATSSAAADSPNTTTPAAEVDGLTIEQLKTLSEEGFIYGLPLVMNYAIMNEVGRSQDPFLALSGRRA